MTLRSLLVANRGEIACRIIRTAREMGIRTVAVYSDADRDAPHVRAAHAAFHIGPAEAAQSYLDGARILDAARKAGADAVHPGYGFLAENADFAAACTDAGLRFVGPPAEVIRVMGSKIEAKNRAVAAGVPVVPGYNGADQSDAGLCAQAEKIGFPLLIKASAGGGGRGMRVVARPEDLPAALCSARAEAKAGFGDPALLLERYVRTARHIEVQVLADAHGHVVHLFERDCSLQRNHQKVIEEAPAPNLSDALRQKILSSAVQLCRAIGYQNAGTVEYLLDAASGAFFFLEMNTRLQVEHPVTEAVTGLDLVALQLRVAAGDTLDLRQEDIQCHGWAIEARVAAENPAEGYRPETGEITAFTAPEGCRTDSGVTRGSVVSHHYDSMLAKVIAHAADRPCALAALAAGVAEMRIEGVGTNLGFLADLLRVPAFRDGRHDTATILDLYPDGWHPPTITDSHRAAAVLARYLADCPAVTSPFQRLGPWRSIALAGRRGRAVYYLDRQPAILTETTDGWDVTLGDAPPLRLCHVQTAPGSLTFEHGCQRFAYATSVTGSLVALQIEDHRLNIDVQTGEEAHLTDKGASTVTGHQILAPMPGLVVEVLHDTGARLRAGDPVIVIEAMKLMQTLTAPCDGILTDIPHRPGETVERQSVLATFTPEETPQ